MDLEKRKKLLGDFYLPLNSPHTKEEYISKINGFINQLPNFKPYAKRNHLCSVFRAYEKNNNVKFLDLYYFMNESMPYELRGGNNSVGICVDENNVKHIILKRSIYTANELSKNHSINTIKMVYKVFVYNMVTPTAVIRDLKEVKSDLANVEYPLITVSENNSVKRTISVINRMNFNDEFKSMNYNANVIYFDLINGKVTYDFSDSAYSAYGLNNIKLLFDRDNHITMNELNEQINEMHQLHIKNIYANHEELMTRLVNLYPSLSN